MGSSTSSSIQVSVISRNERVNVINYSNKETSISYSKKDKIVESESSKICESLEVPSSSRKDDHIKPVALVIESDTKSNLPSATYPRLSYNARSQSKTTSSPDSETASDRDELQEKNCLIACTECDAKLKSRRAMLSHLDRHLSIPVSCRACHRSFNSLAALRFHYEDFCISKTLVCPQCEEVGNLKICEFCLR